MPAILAIAAFIIASAAINGITNEIANVLGPLLLLAITAGCIGVIAWTFRK